MDDVEVQDLSDKERTHARKSTDWFCVSVSLLIKELTALENVRLPLLKKGTGRLEADERSLQLLNELGLKDKSNRPAYKLSGGEQQKGCDREVFGKFSEIPAR